MDNIQQKKLNALYHKIRLKYGLSMEEIKQLAESPYEFTKEATDKLKLKEIESQEEFDSLKTNFLYKYLGKLHTNYKSIEGRRKQSETFKEINKKKWEKE